MRPNAGVSPPPGPTNWAGNIVFHAERTRTPATVEELCEIVAGSGEARVLGSGHSFNTIADTTGDQISVSGLPRIADVDPATRTLSVSAGLRFAAFTGAAHAEGLALHNLGSLPHISLAGACATGTHGSGTRNGSLATAVRALDIVTSDGRLRTLERGDEDFAGAVVSLGCLGVVTRMTLDLVPAFEMRQWVYEGVGHGLLRDHLDDVLSAAYSVSAFTDWGTRREAQLWVKERVGDAPGPGGPHADLVRRLGGRPADGPRHPVPGMDPSTCTVQGGVPGPWHERLPHFRPEFTPSNGDELQSEYFVAREDAPAAFDALSRIADRIAPVLQIGEIRAVAADELWLSPAQGRDSVAFHFTWVPDTAAVTAVLHDVEEALDPFDARPHWGKVFVTAPERLREVYGRFADFEALVDRYDPKKTFRNAFVTELSLGR